MIPCTKIFRGEGTVHTDKKSGPLFVWNLTSKCNLTCSHCYRDSSLANNNHGSELSDEKCLAMASEIKGLNPPIVLLTGGEPLMRRNIFDIVKACKANGLRVGFSTNGTLIDQKKADKIQQSGIDYVGVSIDGQEESHDLMRGLSGAFVSSWQALKFLNERGVKTGVRFTLTRANRLELMDILEKTLEIGSKRFCLYHLVYAGRASQSLDMSLEEKRACMDKFFRRIKELSLSDPQFEALTTDSPADGLYLSKFAVSQEASFSCICAHGGCSAGERVAYLDSTGEVYPCQFLRDQSLGNVKDRSLQDIWTDEKNIFLQELHNKKDFLKGRCGECRHKAICGGCRSRAKACSGSLWAEDPACYLEYAEIKNEALYAQL